MSNKSHSLLKAEDLDAYKKLASEGVMLAHPVKINGEHIRPDTGLGYHASIKVFDKDRDHPHAIHDLAQHLPLNPPDAKNTQIEPGQFKDRFGNDVYVLKLKGNSADKLKEHHGKFAHMGHPENYEFTPHISVPKALHDKVKASGVKTAHEAGIEFGPAELKQGHKTIKTYHHKPDSSDTEFPDEGDLTAKMKAPVTKSEPKLCPLHKAEKELVDNDEDAHALLNRREDKYFLPRKYIEKVISELSTRFVLGDIDTGTRYCRNKTVYLDDKDLSAFRGVVSKTVPRTKVRIRQYSPNNQGWEQVAYAEFKIKEENGQSKKIRVRIPAECISELSEGGKIVFDESLVNINKDIEREVLEHRVVAINDAIVQKGLHKQLEIQYERRAYSGKNLRITIDDDLNFFDSRSIDPTVKENIHRNEDWKKFLKPYLLAAWDNPLILEVKSGESVPSWLKKLLKDVEAKEVSFSKYGAAMVTHLRTSGIDGKILSRFEEPPGPMHKSEDLQILEKGEKKNKIVDISVVILRDGNFILVGKRRRNDKWGLPGGRSEDKSEDSKSVALRELKEETGLKLKAEDLLLAGVKEIKGKRVYVYTAKYPGGEPTTENDPDEEFTGWRWIRCEDNQLPDEFFDREMNPPTKAAFDELDMTKADNSLNKTFEAVDPKKPGISSPGLNVRALNSLKGPKARVEAAKKIKESMSHIKKPPNQVLSDWEKLTLGSVKDAYKQKQEERSKQLPKEGIPEPKVGDKEKTKTLVESEDIHGQKPLLKPYVSEAQRRWAHTNSGLKALGGQAGVHEWDEATKGKKLPEKVSKEESLEKGALKNAAIGGLMGLGAMGSHPAHADYNHVDSYLNSLKGKVPGVQIDTKLSPGVSHGKLSVGKFHVHTNAMLGGKSPISDHKVTLSGPKKETWSPQDSQDYENAKFLHQHLTDVMPKLMQMTGPVKKSELDNLQKGALKNAALGAGMLAAAASGHQAQAHPKAPMAPKQQVAHQVSPGRSPASIKSVKPYVEPYNHNKMLRAIAQVESSNNPNVKHGEGGGKIHGHEHAYGRYGLMPETIRETIGAHKDLRQKYGKALALKGPQLHHFMHDNKGLEDVIADRHLSHMEHVLGQIPEHLGFGWLNGTEGTLKARKAGEDINNHWHARKIRRAYDGIK